MHINHLRYSILWRILLETAKDIHSDVKKWKTYLPLLAVCSYWRDILEPIIYTLVFAVYMKDNTVEPLYSNLDLFTSQHLCNIATKAIVSFDQVEDCFTWTNGAIVIFAGHPHPFISVRELEAQVRIINYVYSDIPKVHVALDNNDMMVLADTFIQKLPKVNRVYFNSNVFEKLDHVYEYILKTYLPRAHIVHIYQPTLTFNFKHWSPQITHLDINFSGLFPFNYFPLVNSKSLKSLKLLNIPKDFIFSPFADADQFSSISFNNLEELFLGYKARFPEPKSPIPFHFSMAFPKLQHLSIHDISLRCDIVYAKSFPKLKYLHYKGSIRALEQLALAQYGSLVHIFLESVNLNTKLDRFYSSTNQLISQMDSRLKTRLVLNSLPFGVKPASIKWDRLKSLVLYAGELTFNFVCELLQRLYNLKHLRINELLDSKFDKSSGERLGDMSDDKQYILSFQLECFSILKCPVDDIDSILYLVVYCPSIKKVKLDQFVLDRVHNRAFDFVKQYPHIIDIEWTLANWYNY